MKILLLTFYYPPDLSAGSFRSAALIKALQALRPQGLEVEVLTTMPNRYHSMARAAAEVERSDGVTIKRFSLPPHRSGMYDQAHAFGAYARSVYREARRGDWDAVVATSSRLMTAALGAFVARTKGVPLYLDIRDLFTDTMRDVLAGRTLRFGLPLFRLLETWTLNAASAVNVVSEGFFPHVKAVAPQHRYRSFTNGIDGEFLLGNFAPKPSAFDRPPLIVYAGNMGDGQGLHHIIPQAAKRLGHAARFRLIGDGGQKRKLEVALKEAGVKNVELLTPVPREDLYAHYRDADCLFLHLNDHAAFRKVLPSKIFEYGATDKPILAGVAGYAADFIKSQLPGSAVFPPCDEEGFVDAWSKIEGQRAGGFNRDAFKEKFSRTKIMADMARDVINMAEEAREERGRQR